MGGCWLAFCKCKKIIIIIKNRSTEIKFTVTVFPPQMRIFNRYCRKTLLQGKLYHQRCTSNVSLVHPLLLDECVHKWVCDLSIHIFPHPGGCSAAWKGGAAVGPVPDGSGPQATLKSERHLGTAASSFEQRRKCEGWLLKVVASTSAPTESDGPPHPLSGGGGEHADIQSQVEEYQTYRYLYTYIHTFKICPKVRRIPR